MVAIVGSVTRAAGPVLPSRRPTARRVAAVRWLSAPVLFAAMLITGCQASRVAGPAVPAATALPSNYLVECDSRSQTPRVVRNLDAVGTAQRGAPVPFSDAVAFQIARAIDALAPIVVHAVSAPTLRLAIVTDDLSPRLAWSIIGAQDGGCFSWTVTVDARGGAVLRVAQNWIDG